MTKEPTISPGDTKASLPPATCSACLGGSDVLTHHAPHCSPAWLAIHVPTARKVLAGYADANFDDIGQLMCDYCNVLDLAGVLHYGDTEAEVVRLAQPNSKLRDAAPKL